MRLCRSWLGLWCVWKRAARKRDAAVDPVSEAAEAGGGELLGSAVLTLEVSVVTRDNSSNRFRAVVEPMEEKCRGVLSLALLAGKAGDSNRGSAPAPSRVDGGDEAINGGLDGKPGSGDRVSRCSSVMASALVYALLRSPAATGLSSKLSLRGMASCMSGKGKHGGDSWDSMSGAVAGIVFELFMWVVPERIKGLGMTVPAWKRRMRREGRALPVLEAAWPSRLALSGMVQLRRDEALLSIESRFETLSTTAKSISLVVDGGAGEVACCEHGLSASLTGVSSSSSSS